MSEAPKKIWIDPEYIEDENDCVSRVKIMHRDVEYIRADLVDGLVKALEDLVSLCEAGLDSDYDVDAELTDAKAALKAMKEV